jgi:hypothetical protein
MQQLNNTALEHIVRVPPPHAPRSTCLLCLRPIALDQNVRTVPDCALYGQILAHSTPDTANAVYQAQLRYLQHASAVHVCYICQPASKKAEQQLEERRGGAAAPPPYPSLCVLATLEHCASRAHPALNRLSLLKGLICLATSLQAPGKTCYNELRSAALPLLEYSILMLLHVFAGTRCDVREFTRTHDAGVFAVVVLCKWHLLGYPHAFPDPSDSKVFRRAYDTSLFALFCSLNAGVPLAGLRDHDLASSARNVCSACAGQGRLLRCAHYDTSMLDIERLSRAAHEHQRDPQTPPGVYFLCKHTRAFGLVSYEFYCEVAARFPPQFREPSEARYYLRALVAHAAPGTNAAPAWTRADAGG